MDTSRPFSGKGTMMKKKITRQRVGKGVTAIKGLSYVALYWIPWIPLLTDNSHSASNYYNIIRLVNVCSMCAP